MQIKTGKTLVVTVIGHCKKSETGYIDAGKKVRLRKGLVGAFETHRMCIALKQLNLIKTRNRGRFEKSHDRLHI